MNVVDNTLSRAMSHYKSIFTDNAMSFLILCAEQEVLSSMI